MKKIFLILLILITALMALMALFPEKATQLGVTAERFRSGLTDKTVAVDGETWHYLEGGATDADVLLLLHGFGGDKDNWTRFSKYLTEGYRVIAPDLPGFGQSVPHLEWDYSLPPQRDRLNGFITALGLTRFHVVGNSMGGHLAALYAREFPQQLLSLALFNNAGVVSPEESDLWQALAKGENPLVVESIEDFDKLITFVTHKPPFIPWPMKKVFAQAALDHVELNRIIFDSLISDTESLLDPILPEINGPTLILWGEYDRVLHVSSVEVMQRLLTRSEVVIMKDTGHLPMIERPAETAEHYLGFLNNL